MLDTLRPAGVESARGQALLPHTEEVSMRRTFLSVIAVLSVVALVALPAGAADPKSYKIGAILAMTGGGAFYGKVMSQGAQLAMDELNAKGGIDGIKFELVVEDHKSGQPKEAVSAINKLVNIDKVPFVLTSYSSPTLAILPIATEHKVLLLNGGGVSPKLVQPGSVLFHNRVLASYQALGVVDRAKERGFKKMAMLHLNDDAGNGVRDFIVPIWKKMGGTVVADEAHPWGPPTLRPRSPRSSRPSPTSWPCGSGGRTSASPSSRRATSASRPPSWASSTLRTRRRSPGRRSRARS